MKKNLSLVLALFVAGGVFAEEHTIYLDGSVGGIITVQKDPSGKVTVLPRINRGWVWIGKTICPLLPEDGFSIRNTTKSIVIDGDTTTETNANASSWRKTVLEGNTMTEIGSNNRLITTVLEGNTLTRTHPNQTMTTRHFRDDGSYIAEADTVSVGWWQKIVVAGNTMTETDSLGYWARAVINGNTTTVTKDGKPSYEEVIRGNTRTLTHSYGGGYREVVDGNTITVTSLDGKNKEVVDRQGNDIFITITGYAFDNIGMSEKDRVKNVIDGITSGRIKDGLFYELIDYGR
jgi:hypothetical protein